MNPSTTSRELDPALRAHAYALDVSGYTVLRGQVASEELVELRRAADQALAEAQRVVKCGGKLSHTACTKYYWSCRCLYCWNDACLRLLELDAIHELSAALMGSYRLWDMSGLSARPISPGEKSATTSWHRDFGGLALGGRAPGYLWFFLCLEDVTAENGATWVVPGSHRVPSRFEPALGGAWTGDEIAKYPSRVQLTGRAGDLLILDPTLLHTSGRNETAKPRTLIAISICSGELSPLLDHWAICGPRIRGEATERQRRMLGAERTGLAQTWEALPEDWIAGAETIGAHAR